MNEVWKNLDPIFQITLRKYVTQNNRSLFEVYAKALGFHSDHIQLLYNTLQNLECDSNHINRKRSYSEMNNSHNPNEDNNHHNQIRNKRIKTEHNDYDNYNNYNDQLKSWHTISVYNDNHTSKNTKNTEIIKNPSVNRNKMRKETEMKEDEALIHSVVIRDISSPIIPRSESSIIRSESTNRENTISKSTNSRTGVLKIPSPLPLYNIYRSPLYSKKYQELINKSNETRKQNHNYDVVLSKYEKLKNLSSQSFKQDKNGATNSTKDIAVSNKKRINALLGQCHSYKNLLNKRGKKLNQNIDNNRKIIS